MNHNFENSPTRTAFMMFNDDGDYCKKRVFLEVLPQTYFFRQAIPIKMHPSVFYFSLNHFLWYENKHRDLNEGQPSNPPATLKVYERYNHFALNPHLEAPLVSVTECNSTLTYLEGWFCSIPVYFVIWLQLWWKRLSTWKQICLKTKRLLVLLLFFQDVDVTV